MYTTCKDGTKGDPQEYDRSPEGTLHGTKNRSQTCDVQKLYQKQLPLWHNHIVDSVIDPDCRCLSVVRCKRILNDLTIDKIPSNQKSKTDNEA